MTKQLFPLDEDIALRQITSMNSSKDLLTESRLKTFRRCPREEKIRYQMGYTPTTLTDTLLFGTLVHIGLEAWWKENQFKAALAKMADSAASMICDYFDHYDYIHASELLRGYDVRWRNAGFETIAVEKEFTAHLINPETDAPSKTWNVAGKLDVIAKKEGKYYLIEHKTSSEDIGQGSAYWARLRMDGQISGYFHGAKTLGYDIETCIYDVLGKTRLRPYKATPQETRKYKANGELYANQRTEDEAPESYAARIRNNIAENPDKYYQRGEVVRLENEIREYDLERWQLGGLMRDMKRLNIAPRNPDACSRFGRTCSYFDVCSGEESLEDQSKFTKLGWAFSELTEPK